MTPRLTIVDISTAATLLEEAKLVAVSQIDGAIAHHLQNEEGSTRILVQASGDTFFLIS